MVLDVTAPLWSDISDRLGRLLGRVSLVDLGLNYSGQIIPMNNDAVDAGIPGLYSGGGTYAFNGATWDRLRCSQKALINRARPWQVRQQSGRILALDDFESTLRWLQVLGTCTKASDAGGIWSGGSAMKMVTGGAAGNQAQAEIILPMLDRTSTYYSCGCWFSLQAAAAVTPRDFYIEWTLNDNKVGVSPIFRARYLHYNAGAVQHKLQYWQAAATWVDVPSGGMTIDPTLKGWNWLEIIGKRGAGGTGTYEGIRFDDSYFSLTGQAAEQQAYNSESMYVSMFVTTDVAAVTTAYVDDFVLVDQLQEIP